MPLIRSRRPKLHAGSLANCSRRSNSRDRRVHLVAAFTSGLNAAMPVLPRRDPDRTHCWRIHCGDVHVGTIARASAPPARLNNSNGNAASIPARTPVISVAARRVVRSRSRRLRGRVARLSSWRHSVRLSVVAVVRLHRCLHGRDVGRGGIVMLQGLLIVAGVGAVVAVRGARLREELIG